MSHESARGLAGALHFGFPSIFAKAKTGGFAGADGAGGRALCEELDDGGFELFVEFAAT